MLKLNRTLKCWGKELFNFISTVHKQDWADPTSSYTKQNIHSRNIQNRIREGRGKQIKEHSSTTWPQSRFKFVPHTLLNILVGEFHTNWKVTPTTNDNFDNSLDYWRIRLHYQTRMRAGVLEREKKKKNRNKGEDTMQ